MNTPELDQIADAYPLTPLQSGMLFHILTDPQPGQYIATITALIEGPLDRSAAQTAWQALLDRHEALRTAFHWEGLDQPMQVVHAAATLDFDWTTGDDWQQQASLAHGTEFDLTRAPLMQVRFISEGPDRHRLIWVVHHLIADGWSATVLLREFLQLLNGETLPEAPQFVTHTEWLDGIDHDADADFWHGYFAGLSVDKLTPKGQGTGFERQKATLDPALLKELSTRARTAGVTLGTVIQSGFAQASGQLTGSRDVLFGLATSGRSSPIAGAGDCVGLFVNTLPVRAELDNPDLLSELEETNLALRAREHVPQSNLARWSSTAPGQNMVETVLSLRSLPSIDPVGDFAVSELDARTPSNFPLMVEVDPESGAMSAIFDRKILNPPQVSAFLATFELALRSEIEPQRQVARASGPALETAPLDVVTRIHATLLANPDAIAVRDAQTALTGAELLARASAVASHLVSRSVGPGDLVALVMARSVDMVAGILGTLLAGAAYVPVDASYPRVRKDAILADCKPRLVLSDDRDIEGATGIGELPDAPLFKPVQTLPEHPAYVIYTSGSTGTPKGVEISRAALAASQSARDQFYPGKPQAFLLMSPFAFDSSVVGLFWALTSGATLVISPERAEQDMAALARTISEHRISHTLMLPSLYAILLENANLTSLTSLRQVIVAGEACPRDLPRRHAQVLPDCWLANEYGPTEATVWATAELNGPREAAPMSIGRPIPGMDVFLLNAKGRAVSAGEPGEIALSGPGLATGYLNRVEETAVAFPRLSLANGETCRVYRTGDRGRLSPDGRITYLGRGDGQVKIRGHRIELQEVEASLTDLDGVRDAAVIVTPARPPELHALEAALAALSTEEAASLLAQVRGKG